MRHLVDLIKLNRLDSLIRRQVTGTPKQLSYRLEISVSSLYALIAFLRNEMQAPIRYSKFLNPYIYKYSPKFYLGFEKDMLKVTEVTENKVYPFISSISKGYAKNQFINNRAY